VGVAGVRSVVPDLSRRQRLALPPLLHQPAQQLGLLLFIAAGHQHQKLVDQLLDVHRRGRVEQLFGLGLPEGLQVGVVDGRDFQQALVDLLLGLGQGGRERRPHKDGGSLFCLRFNLILV
jgi:hypothetical protein